MGRPLTSGQRAERLPLVAESVKFAVNTFISEVIPVPIHEPSSRVKFDQPLLSEMSFCLDLEAKLHCFASF